MNIQELLSSGQNVTIAVTPADLREFALTVAEEVKAAMSAKDAQDRRLTAQEAARALGVSVNSLSRGGQRRGLRPSCSWRGLPPCVCHVVLWRFAWWFCL